MIKKLEAIRGFAAIYVVAHHYIGFSELVHILNPVVRFPFRFGQEAVILFFMLSGFVIYYATYLKHDSFKKYMIKRFRRIYPIALIALLLSVLVWYANGVALTRYDYRTLAGNILMLQDASNKPGNWVEVFLKNHALWSLSYEWVFYVVFFPLILLLKPGRSRIYIILAVSGVSWISYLILPNHLSLVLSYLIIWWVGLECADCYLVNRNFDFTSLKPCIVSLGVMCLLALIPIITQLHSGIHHFNPINYPILMFRHFAFAFLIVLAGLTWWKYKLIGFDQTIGLFKVFAPISYAMYVLHFPLLWLNLPFVNSIYIALLLKLVLLLLLSFLLERKMQPALNKLIRS